MEETFKLGFVGAGNMAEAIVQGLVTSNVLPPSHITLFDIREERLNELSEKLGVQSASSVSEVFEVSDFIVLAVKPQNLSDLVSEVKGKLTQGKAAISIMAGITTEKIERAFLHPNNMNPQIIRTMPNTPALVQKGVTAICAGQHASEEQMEAASKIFNAVGHVEIIDEMKMDAITGVTGSGPAYIFKMMESMINAGIQQGLPPASVPKMVKALFSGAAELALQSDVEPDELRRRVTSPNGTTQAGLEALDENHFEEAVLAAVESAVARSVELSKDTK